jgi:hypothetical protein
MKVRREMLTKFVIFVILILLAIWLTRNYYEKPIIINVQKVTKPINKF